MDVFLAQAQHHQNRHFVSLPTGLWRNILCFKREDLISVSNSLLTEIEVEKKDAQI